MRPRSIQTFATEGCDHYVLNGAEYRKTAATVGDYILAGALIHRGRSGPGHEHRPGSPRGPGGPVNPMPKLAGKAYPS